MTNWKAFVGIMWFFILAQMICNMWGGRDMYDNANPYPISVDKSDNYTIYQTDQTVDSLGKTTSVPNFDIGQVGDFFAKLFTFDYPIFENDDGTDNDFVVIRWMLVCVGLIMWIELFLTIRRMILGSG